VVLNQPITAMAATPTGNGYWLLARDGGVFTFGDATFAGTPVGKTGTAFAKGLVATSTGGGYDITDSNADVFAFGDAAFLGSEAHMGLKSPIVTIIP
jgi:hypothetical protein